MTPDALDDAFALDMAMGGTTNTVLHALAIANEAGIDYPLERINDDQPRACRTCARSARRASSTWKTCIAPAASPPSSRRSRATTALLHLDRMTVTGKTLGEVIASVGETKDRDVIRPLEKPTRGAAGWRCCSATWRPRAPW